jgi:hypothetical protein
VLATRRHAWFTCSPGNFNNVRSALLEDSSDPVDLHRVQVLLFSEVYGARDVSPRAPVESTSSVRPDAGRPTSATRSGFLAWHFVVSFVWDPVPRAPENKNISVFSGKFFEETLLD